MIKAILFDVGGVLHKSDTAVGDDMQRELGLTPGQIEEIWSTLIPRMGVGQLDEADFWDEIRQKYRVRRVSPDEKLLSRAFARELKQNKQLLDVAKQLREAGLRVAVLSDTNKLHAAVLEAAGSYKPFAYRFLSHEVGIRKPDPRIFQHALKVLDVKPSESIFIDDSAKNVAAANALGIHGIQFNDTEQVFSELTDLLPYIKLELRPANQITL